jgi:hypothetical protein
LDRNPVEKKAKIGIEVKAGIFGDAFFVSDAGRQEIYPEHVILNAFLHLCV